METKYVNFERVAHLLAIAADEHFSVAAIKSNPFSYTLKYSTYVKSQVHLNMVSSLFNRDISDYVNAFEFLQKYSLANMESAQKVLNYFYEDMSNFLINNTNDINFRIEVDTYFSQLPIVSVSVNDVLQEILAIVRDYSNLSYEELLNTDSKGIALFDTLVCRIQNCKYASILDVSSNIDALQHNPHNLVLAGILKSATNKTIKLD